MERLLKRIRSRKNNLFENGGARLDTLIVCFSLSGKTYTICQNLARFTPASLSRIRTIKNFSKLRAFTSGLGHARRRKQFPLLPLEDDISSYRRIVLACPVWGGMPCPMIYGVLHQYDLEGKEIHCLLTYEKDAGKAPDILKEEVARTGARIASLVTVKAGGKALKKFEEKSLELYIDDEEGICIRKAAKPT